MSTFSGTLTLYDYAIFVATLLSSTSIGIYFGCFGSRQASLKKYILGGKSMRIFPIAISVAISHFSGSAMLAFPADVYRYGASLLLAPLSYIVLSFLAYYVYLPVFFKMQFTSTYEYLEQRFDQKTKILGFVFNLLAEILLFPILVYTPALAFATASGTSVPLVAFILSMLCVVYTTLGGLKSVVWTDILQFVIMTGSLIIIYVVGLRSSGGFASIWNTAREGQRLQLFNFGLDFTERDNFWGYSFGMAAGTMAAIVVHQTGLQKFLALPKYKDSRLTLITTSISITLVTTFCVFIGLETYAKYKNCDPLTSGKIRKHDELLPYFISDIARNIPGVSGLFLAGICSAALSTMSSNLNALSTVIYRDIVCLFLKKTYSEKTNANILKLIGLSVGILNSLLVFAVERMGEIFSLSLMVSGLTKGPLLGAFTLGLLFPRANAKGAFYGTLGGVLFALCLMVPSKYYQIRGSIKFPTKPLSISECGLGNKTVEFVNTTITQTATIKNEPLLIFKTSFYFYPLLSAIVTVILGLIISYLTKRESLVNEDLISPVSRFALPKKSQRIKQIQYSSIEEALNVVETRN